jgi:hypothetical protein
MSFQQSDMNLNGGLAPVALEQPQAPAEAPELPPPAPFEGIDPSLIVKLLQKLDPEETISKKPFFKSYPAKWESLTTDQRNKTQSFWNLNLTDQVRARLLTSARDSLASDAIEENARQAQSNKHDLSRLLHIRKDPSCVADWTAALREKTRVELDTDEIQVP